MPWVKREDCTACETCVDECPVGAITLEADYAEIDMTQCIRCGTCHDVCPQEAVRHDGERIGQRIEENVQMTIDILGHYDTPEDKNGLIGRMKKHFNNEKRIAEATLERLESLQF